MNPRTLSLIGISVLFSLQAPAFADDSHAGHDHSKGGQEHSKAEKAGRKKKRLICRDCGKPETGTPEEKCDCPHELKAKEAAEAAKKGQSQ